MMKRRSHLKSRAGCITCKKGHVKCDEQKPRCANCIVRKRDCIYPGRSRAPIADIRPAREARQEASPASLDSDSQQDTCMPCTPASPSITTVTAPSPLAYSSTRSCNHTLELELIHTWSVKTWAGMQVLPDCGDLLRVDFVREGLVNNFMMDAIFALTAAHHAVMHKEKGNMHDYIRYDHVSVDYGNRASETFRQKLHTATHSDLHLLYYFACMATVLNMLVCRQYRTALECFDVSLTLFLGSFRITETNLDWIHQSDHSIAVRANMVVTPPELYEKLPDYTTQALLRLERVCDTVRVPQDGLTEGPFASDIESYRRAIKQTKVSYAQRAAGQVPGFLFTIVALGGRELAAATAAREPVSLFIHLYGFVLMDQAYASGNLWWVGSVARKTIDEICDILVGSPLGQLEDVQEVMKWAKEQVVLPPSLDQIAPELRHQ